MFDLDKNRNRLAAGIILGMILIILTAYYSYEYENHLPVPSYGAILTNYPIGSEVEVNGDVKQILNDGFLIEENYKGNIVVFKIVSNQSVDLGDKVNVLGVLGPDNTIIKVNGIIISQLWKYYFILFRSFLAMIVLILLFFYFWTFDREKFVFRRR